MSPPTGTPPKTTESPTIRGRFGNTLILDRQIGRFGRIKRATGTNDRELFKQINQALTTLFRTRQYDTIQALVDRRIRPIDLIDLKFTRAGEPITYQVTQIFIYVMRSRSSGNVKIGYAQDVRSRLGSIRGHTWDEIDLLGYAPGTRQEEQRVHRLLREDRIRGEWFSPTPKVYAWVNSFLKKSISPGLNELGVEVWMKNYRKRQSRLGHD